MAYHVTKVHKNGVIYLPKSICQKHGFHDETKIILKITNNGIFIGKPNTLEEIDMFFDIMDVELKETIKALFRLKS